MAELKQRSASSASPTCCERLKRALEPARTAPPRLRERIVAQYPVAMVDEFQDTSPDQFRIFDLLYRVADNDPPTACS